MNRTRSGIRSTDPSSTVAHWVMDSPQELINVQVVIAQRRCHNLSTPQYFTSTHCDIIGPQVAYKRGFFSIFYLFFLWGCLLFFRFELLRIIMAAICRLVAIYGPSPHFTPPINPRSLSTHVSALCFMYQSEQLSYVQIQIQIYIVL